MKKHSVITTFLSVAACRITRCMLRILHRGGTTLPGRAAMVFDKSILEVVSRDMEVIVVTGTNGKTTTCSMLRTALESADIPVLSNISGANLLTGITAEFTANASLLGKAKKHYAIIESDEAALKKVVPYIHPKVIVVTNLFRDQLDRYGEVMHTLEEIRTGIRLSPESRLCLNADDSLVASLASETKNPVIWYGISVPAENPPAEMISDAKYCIRCGTEYQYHFHTYAHLGGFFCPKCGYSRPDPQIEVKAIDEITAGGSVVDLNYPSGPGRFTTKKIRIALPALYNIYNAIAAVAAFQAAGYNKKYIFRALSTVHSSFGRMENFHYNGQELQMILVKNPAGCNQALSYLRNMPEDFAAVFCLNDKTADGHDISWIWDADFESVVTSPRCRKLYAAGTRAEDMCLRLKYAGADASQIRICHREEELLKAVGECGLPVFILPNYTAMLSLRGLLSAATGKKEFWKEQ